jgi:hypothetical protein
MDNERNYSEQRKSNFMAVDKLVMFGSEKDGTITPWTSAWFGYYKDSDDSVQIPMEER